MNSSTTSTRWRSFKTLPQLWKFSCEFEMRTVSRHILHLHQQLKTMRKTADGFDRNLATSLQTTPPNYFHGITGTLWQRQHTSLLTISNQKSAKSRVLKFKKKTRGFGDQKPTHGRVSSDKPGPWKNPLVRKWKGRGRKIFGFLMRRTIPEIASFTSNTILQLFLYSVRQQIGF